MFNNQRYATRGVAATIQPGLQFILWGLVDTLEVAQKDYLQVFVLTADSGKQRIHHSQEQPDYSAEYCFPVSDPITAKVYVIDDGDHSTMLLAEEY